MARSRSSTQEIMTHLPTEAFYNILKYLDLESLAQLASACGTTFSMIKSYLGDNEYGIKTKTMQALFKAALIIRLESAIQDIDQCIEKNSTECIKKSTIGKTIGALITATPLANAGVGIYYHVKSALLANEQRGVLNDYLASCNKDFNYDLTCEGYFSHSQDFIEDQCALSHLLWNCAKEKCLEFYNYCDAIQTYQNQGPYFIAGGLIGLLAFGCMYVCTYSEWNRLNKSQEEKLWGQVFDQSLKEKIEETTQALINSKSLEKKTNAEIKTALTTDLHQKQKEFNPLLLSLENNSYSNSLLSLWYKIRPTEKNSHVITINETTPLLRS